MAGHKPTDFDVRLGGRMRLARQGADLGQKQFAQDLGVSAPQLQKYERGSNRMAASLVQMAARLLGVSVTYFFDPEPVLASKTKSTAADAGPTKMKTPRRPRGRGAEGEPKL